MIQLAIFIILVWLLFIILKNRDKLNIKNNKKYGKKVVACSTCNIHIEEQYASKKEHKFYCKDCL